MTLPSKVQLCSWPDKDFSTRLTAWPSSAPTAVPVNSKPCAIRPMLKEVADAPFTPKVRAGAVLSTTKVALDWVGLPARSATCAVNV